MVVYHIMMSILYQSEQPKNCRGILYDALHAAQPRAGIIKDALHAAQPRAGIIKDAPTVFLPMEPRVSLEEAQAQA